MGHPGEVTDGEKDGKTSPKGNPRSAPQHPGQPGEDLSDVVLAWANLSQKVRAAILALIDAAKGGTK